MIKNKDIIITGIQSWDIDIGSNCKNIAIEFAKYNRVLYVNSPLDRMTALRNPEKAKSFKAIGDVNHLRKLNENFWVYNPPQIIESISRFPIPLIFDALNKRNNRLFAQDIKKAIKELNFNNYILFCDSDMFRSFYLKDLLSPELFVYYMRDNLKSNPFWKVNGVRLEPQLIRKADLVVNNSIMYTEYGAKYNKYSYMVGQGCDTTLFDGKRNKLKIPVDIRHLPHPIIGYVGFLSSRRLDIALLEYLATNKKEWSFVFVGPEDETFQNSLLHSMKNVFFIGKKSVDELPGYIYGFDVAINPQKVNDATQGNYPRKIDEYLAVGKPVVATQTKAMDYFRDYTYLANSKEEYIRLISLALIEDCKELQSERTTFGTSHTWKKNVELIYKYISLRLQEKHMHYEVK